MTSARVGFVSTTRHEYNNTEQNIAVRLVKQPVRDRFHRVVENGTALGLDATSLIGLLVN